MDRYIFQVDLIGSEMVQEQQDKPGFEAGVGVQRLERVRLRPQYIGRHDQGYQSARRGRESVGIQRFSAVILVSSTTAGRMSSWRKLMTNAKTRRLCTGNSLT